MLTRFVDLTAHHTIEERHIFPYLAKRMPSFKEDEQHIKSHHGIHEGTKRLLLFSPSPHSFLSFLALLFVKILCTCADRFLPAFFPGLDKLGTLIAKWLAEPSSYSPQEMRECLDSWREVLFRHLDEEVGTSRFYPSSFHASFAIVVLYRDGRLWPHCG